MTAATASAVSHILANAKIPRSRWLRSGRVRGWANLTEGFTAETITEAIGEDGAKRPTGTVSVTWCLNTPRIPGDVDKGNREIAYAAEVLTEKGYSVKQHTDDASGLNYLHVTKEDWER